MTTEVISPAPRGPWEAALAENPDTSIYQTPAWLDCVCTAGPYEDASRLYETADGRPPILPMARRRGLPGPLTIEGSLPPRWGFAGILGPDPLRASDVATVTDDLARRHVLRTSVKPGPRVAAIWRSGAPLDLVQVPHFVQTLDLSRGFEHVWARRFSTKTRTKVRKAERSGLDVHRDSTGRLVDAYYSLYLKSIER